MEITKTVHIIADRLKEGDTIVVDGQKAIVVSAFVYGGEQRLKIVRSVDVGLEDRKMDPYEIVEMFLTK